MVTPMPRRGSGRRRRPLRSVKPATGVIRPDLKITLRTSSESSGATVHAITGDALAQVWTGATNLVGRARRDIDTPRERSRIVQIGAVTCNDLIDMADAGAAPVGDRKCGVCR